VSGFRIFILAAATLAVTPIWFIYLDLLREIWSDVEPLAAPMVKRLRKP